MYEMNEIKPHSSLNLICYNCYFKSKKVYNDKINKCECDDCAKKYFYTKKMI